MFERIKERRAEKLYAAALAYVQEHCSAPVSEKPKPDLFGDEEYVRYSRISGYETLNRPENGEEARVSCSRRNVGKGQGDTVLFSMRDNYNGEVIDTAMRSLPDVGSPSRALRALDESTDVSFVDRMLEYISDKRLRDSAVYKAAQVDRRLFSKIVSDSAYKPAKDTCVALCLGMKLTLPEAEDLLARAGYVFSHSDKRDVVIEFFFREGVYDLNDVNMILSRLHQKVLGRF